MKLFEREGRRRRRRRHVGGTRGVMGLVVGSLIIRFRVDLRGHVF